MARKGQKLTPEQCKQRSDTLKRKYATGERKRVVHSAETRKKISDAMNKAYANGTKLRKGPAKGTVPVNKGKKMNPEQKINSGHPKGTPPWNKGKIKERPLGEYFHKVKNNHGVEIQECYIKYDIDKIPMLKYKYLMEQHLGRKLVKGEQVHHINLDHSDDRIENLQVMTKKAHYLLHRKLTQFKKSSCKYCCDIVDCPDYPSDGCECI